VASRAFYRGGCGGASPSERRIDGCRALGSQTGRRLVRQLALDVPPSGTIRPAPAALKGMLVGKHAASFSSKWRESIWELVVYTAGPATNVASR
jgi:hypothetical protein